MAALCFVLSCPGDIQAPSLSHIVGSMPFSCRNVSAKRPHRASRRKTQGQMPRMSSSDPSSSKKASEESNAPFDLPNAPDDPARNDGRATAGLFGIRIETNGDVIKFGFVAIAIAYAFKYSLTLFGVRDLLAGQITTGFVSVASLLGWVST